MQNIVFEKGLENNDYTSLAIELSGAYNQASSGKGVERHATGEAFKDQLICEETRRIGFGFPLGQARKKIVESLRLLELRGANAAIHELHGAINYIAAACIVMREKLKDSEKQQ